MLKKISLFDRVSAGLREIGTLVRDVFATAETPRFCCGVAFERTRVPRTMPTPGSCCGVRV